LGADVAVTHVALDFRFGNERRNGVDDDQIDRVGADEHVGDFEGLLAVVGLADEKLLGFDAELFGVEDVERVLGVDERGDASLLLDIGDGVERERGFAARLGPVDLDDATARVAPDAEREVEPDRPGGDDGNLLVERFAIFEAHDGALAELFFDACDGQLEGFAAILVVHGSPSPHSFYTAHSFSSQDSRRRVGHCFSSRDDGGLRPDRAPSRARSAGT
jgi:hypothetical protein